MNSFAIIITHYGDVKKTEACVRSISEQEYGNYQIVVIDNSNNFSSSDNSVLICSNENRGYGNAVNVGIKKALELGFENFLIMNNDLILERNFLSEFFAAFDVSDKIIAVPRIHYASGKNKIWFNGGYVSRTFWEGVHKDIDKEISKVQIPQNAENIDFFTGACFFINRETYETIGEFDETFFLYYEDLDYSLKAAREGVKIIYVPSAVCYHDVSFSTSRKNGLLKFGKKIYYYRIRNKMIILKRYSSFPANLIAWSSLIVKFSKYFFGFLILMKKDELLCAVKGLADGFKEN